MHLRVVVVGVALEHHEEMEKVLPLLDNLVYRLDYHEIIEV